MIDPTMRIKVLPEYLIIHNFVKGVDYCNYEKYLIELLNNSNYFLQLGKSEFRQPKTESKGENDAIADNYSLDFKLAASTSLLQAKSILTPQVFTNGAFTLHGVSKTPNGSVKSVWLHTALRDKKLDDLEAIRNKETRNCNFIEKDIQSFLKVLETNKNILLFIPYEFSFDNKISFENAVNSINEGIRTDFSISCKYRTRIVINKDTFFCCIYDSNMLFFRFSCDELLLIDCVPLASSQTYQRLLEYKMW